MSLGRGTTRLPQGRPPQNQLLSVVNAAPGFLSQSGLHVRAARIDPWGREFPSKGGWGIEAGLGRHPSTHQTRSSIPSLMACAIRESYSSRSWASDSASVARVDCRSRVFALSQAGGGCARLAGHRGRVADAGEVRCPVQLRQTRGVEGSAAGNSPKLTCVRPASERPNVCQQATVSVHDQLWQELSNYRFEKRCLQSPSI